MSSQRPVRCRAGLFNYGGGGIEAVLFDNDGLLVDTESAFFEVTAEAFAGENADLTAGYWAKTYLREGRTSREIAGDLGVRADRIEILIEERNRIWRERIEAGVPLRPNVRETLQALAGKVRMAIVTGSPAAQFDAVHRFTDLRGFFEAVVTSDDYERSKPHPDAYIAAIGMIGLPAGRCVAVEDSPRGVAAALSAGLRCILVPTELTDLPACRDATCRLVDISGLVRVIFGDSSNP